MLPVFCVTPLPWTSREWTIAPLFFAVIVTDPALALPCEGVSLYSVSPMVRLAPAAAGGAAEVVVGAGAGVLAGDEADFLLLPPHPATASAPDDTSATAIMGYLMGAPLVVGVYLPGRRLATPPSYTPRRSRTIRVTWPPSARPFVSRITYPTMGPMASALPARTLSAASGLASIAARTVSSSSPPPPIVARPSDSTIAAGSPPSATRRPSTCCATADVTPRPVTRPASRARASGATFDSAGSASSSWLASSATQLASDWADTSAPSPAAATARARSK